MSDSYSSSSYFYSSTTSTSNGTERSGRRYVTSSHTDPAGNTTVRTAHQDLGEPVVIEERHYDSTGQEMLPSTEEEQQQWAAGGWRRITDIRDDEDYNLEVPSSTGPAPTAVLDTSSNQDLTRETNLPNTSSPSDDPSGNAIGRYRSSVDEGAVDPVTGNRYSQMDLD